jgi:hypothetical protein
MYDVTTKTVLHNVGAEGTSFVGGGKVGYSPVTFATVQTAVTPVRMMGTIELASRDWERPQEDVTLNWTAPGAAATLWVVYSNEPIASAPGEFTQSTNSAVAIAAEPVTKLDFAAAATAGTVYFVPSLDFKGFSLAGVDTDYTGTIDENGLGSDLYKVVLNTGSLTVTKIGF